MFTQPYLRSSAPVSPITRGGKVIARLECTQCGTRDEWTIAGPCPPAEILPKHFTTKGWNLRKRPICPQCTAQAKKENPMSDLKSEKPANMPQLQIVPTDAVKAARRDATEKLLFHFDAAKGCYEEGWSDARIAKETGMPEAWVSKRREEDFGPLKEPGEFAEVRAEAKALASEIGKLQSKLDAMAKRNGWAN